MEVQWSVGFIGKYKHTLDSKGRVFIPKQVLAAIPEGEPQEFIITRGFEGCLVLYSPSAWGEAVAILKEKARGDAELRAFRRMMHANAQCRALDTSGRILIPEELRQLAGLKRDVVFLGINDALELWDSERWQSYAVEVAPKFEQVGNGVL